MRTTLPRIVALAPGGLDGVAATVAAARAGAVGVLDLAGVLDDAAIADAVGRLARFGDGPFAVRLAAGMVGGSWLDAAPDSLRAVICLGPGGDWGRVARSGRLGWAEVTSRADADEAERRGAAALVVAGEEAGGAAGSESTFVALQAALASATVPVYARGGIGPDAAAGCLAMGAAGVVLDGALLLARESPLTSEIRARVARLDGSRDASAWARPFGQDAAFADDLARRFVTVGGIVVEVERAIDAGLAAATSARPLAEGSAFAVAHGTRYPIMQGPMTRVSDLAGFAGAVADGGALPFLALALMRGDSARALMAAAATTLAGRPWGVGLLGFADAEVRREQVAAAIEMRPPFALIAGGRPDQAAELQRAGIATYLHAPSPALLARYLREGARRFVLEGRECGGHVGPRSSLVLWGQAVGVIRAEIAGGVPASEISIAFAGGVHDDRSAACVAAMAAPLATLGVKVGVLVGTAYLFADEAIAHGAIAPRYRDEAIRCGSTVLLESGHGHEVRVAPSPFVDAFQAERSRLLAEGRPAVEVREALERLNVGRLRIAAKGLEREGNALVEVAEPGQVERGLYMLGQAATLRDRPTTIAAIHREICDGSAARIEATTVAVHLVPKSKPSDIAIVGMSAIFPGAADVRTFWENTLAGRDAIEEIPSDRWDWRLYYDADPKAADKVVSKWGGFVPDVAFDPLRYGMPPSSLPSIEPVQLLLLEAARAAIADAGYADRPFDRERAAVVLGMGGGAAQLAMGYAFRSYLPMLDTVIPGGGRGALEACGDLLPTWTEDSFPGFLLNVAAGRLANRFDLGGANYTVDAACGSSLAAAALAVRELESGAADVVILGGADTVQNPFTYLAFSKTQAFSPRGRCRPFDASADGIVISEGVAVVILKRLADAERDGDRIYSIIKGLGASSDGRARGLTAPNPEGQSRALHRAYERAGVGPETVGYVEAHGTGTPVGDVVEVNALAALYRESGVGEAGCAIGSVKSMIGHTKCAAGLAGLINASLALYHEILPPTIGVDTLNPKADLAGGPFHVNARPRPWLRAGSTAPRRAGVSAFGFGGTNFHAVLEAYDRSTCPADAPSRDWPAELLAWRGPDRPTLLADLDRLARSLEAGARPALRDLAAAVNARPAGPGPTLAIVASTLDDLRAKLDRALAAIRGGSARLDDPAGVRYAEAPEFAGSKVAFLFPGQGAQSVGMLGDLVLTFPEVRGAFDAFDAALVARGGHPIGPAVFPPPSTDPNRARAALIATEVAQPAVGAASVGMLSLLESLGVRPDLAGGHSYGELVALHAAGVLGVDALAELSEARGQLVRDALPTADPGAMAALGIGPDAAAELIAAFPGVVVANRNGPHQAVVAGPSDAIASAVAEARRRGLAARPLAVAGAFHTAGLAAASRPLADRAAGLIAEPPRIDVYANLDARPHPADPAAIAQRLGAHLAAPVRFDAMVDAMYADGARVFLEVGPGGALAPLVGSILGDRPHSAIATDAPGRPGVPALLDALARLVVAGVPARLDRLAAGRSTRALGLEKLPVGDGAPPPAPTTWLVNGSRARPIAQPEAKRLGQGPALPIPAPNLAPAATLNGHRDGPAAPARNGKPMNQPTHEAPVPAPAGSDRVILAFQETMRTFLEVQRSTMLAYLAGRPAPVPTPAPAPTINGHASKSIIPAPSSNGHAAKPAPAEPTPTPASTPPTIPAAPRTFDREAVAARLLEIVRDRTGYPIETLGLELDLEADLGIDSIKRVEILGTLRDAVPGLDERSDSTLMDALTRARTLGAIADRVAASAAPTPRPQPTAVAPVPAPTAAARPIRRLRVEAVEAPLPEPGPGLLPGGSVAVTDDGRGVGRAVAEALRASGRSATLAGAGDVDWTSPAAVDAWLDQARAAGPLAGIVHALPLRDLPEAGLDPARWAGRIGPEVTGLFLLARAAADDLARAARLGGSGLVAATAMGGGFAGVGPAGLDFFPGQGGIAGLVKTLAREWPGVRARVVDLNPRDPVDALAARILDELGTDDDWSEVGYLQGRRIRLRTASAPRSTAPNPAGFEPKPSEPVLITGGARGITAAVAIELARRHRPTLLLVGSGSAPDGVEDGPTAGIDDPAALKAAIYARLRREGQEAGPAAVERAFRTLRRSREVQANVRAMQDAGSDVVYAQADVRDGSALAQVLAAWRDRHGDPVGLIHGAGVIQDKLLRDKTPESFDRVFGTKLEGALNLARLVRPGPLRFAGLFSSVAGRFGNLGQSDYAAANEALNKLAVWLDRRWPGRVVSIGWGPWSGVGMVSDLEGHLGRRGLGMIAPEAGRAFLADEWRFGRKGEVEIVAAGDLGTLEGPVGDRPPAAIAGARR